MRGSNFNETLIGDANSNFLGGGLGADNLSGDAGNDFADYSNASIGVVADLSNPSSNTGEAAGDGYVSIESLVGSQFNDTLVGDGGVNFLMGRGGADILNGGAGSDYADYFRASTGMTVDLSNPANNTGEAAGDTFTSIENIRGSAFDDTLAGNSVNNVLNGGLGADILDGGSDDDFASYADSSIGVTASLANPSSNTGEAAGDTYISIVSLVGSNFDDTLTGDG